MPAITCQLCLAPIDPEEGRGYIVTSCSKCGDSPYHEQCVVEFKCARIKKYICNSSGAKKLEHLARERPWKELPSLGNECPAGILGATDVLEGQSRLSGNPCCPGRVLHNELVAPAGAKKKHKKVASQAPPPPPPQQQPRRQQQQQQRDASGHHVEPRRRPPPPAQQERRQGAPALSPLGRPALSFKEPSEDGDPYENAPAAPPDISDDEQQHHPLQDNALTPDEAEAAVHAGLLPSHFRTQLCASLHGGAAAADCPRRGRCTAAHSLEELRLEAGIKRGTVPVDYKLHLCADFVATGACAAGAGCALAHSPSELRVPQAVRLGHLAPDYKTQVCVGHEFRGGCSEGLACHYAHGAAELRREAAAALGVVPATYKTQLCANYAKDGRCDHGSACGFAHGARDVRVLGGIRLKRLPADYKSSLCPEFEKTGECQRLKECAKAHGAGELRSPIADCKALLCPFLKETGEACGGECPFAHDVSQLRIAGLKQRVQEHRAGSGFRPAALARLPSAGSARGSSTSGPYPGTNNNKASKLHRTGRGPRDQDWGFASGSGSFSKHSGSAASDAGRKPHQPQRKGQTPEGRGRTEGGGGKRGFVPKECRPCRHIEESGDCYLVGCPFAHSQEEADERYERWRESERQRKEEEARLAEQAAAAKATAAEDELQQQAELLAQYGIGTGQYSAADVAEYSGGNREQDFLSEAVVEHMQRHKRAQCILQLIEMGVPDARAAAAADAAGADVERAAQLVFDGAPINTSSPPPIDISQEAREIVLHGEALGLAPDVVDLELVLAEGDWAAAAQALVERRWHSDELPQREDVVAAGAALMSTSPPRSASSLSTLPVPVAVSADFGLPPAIDAATANSMLLAAAAAPQQLLPPAVMAPIAQPGLSQSIQADYSQYQAISTIWATPDPQAGAALPLPPVVASTWGQVQPPAGAMLPVPSHNLVDLGSGGGPHRSWWSDTWGTVAATGAVAPVPPALPLLPPVATFPEPTKLPLAGKELAAAAPLADVEADELHDLLSMLGVGA